jgi:Protein of unknown function (DUF4245)
MLAAGSLRAAVVSDHGAVSEQETVRLPPSTRPRVRGSRTIGDMIRSLIVVGGCVVVLVLIVPRPSAVNQPPVDVAGIAQGATADAHFTLEVPQGLPSEWRPTSASLLTSVDSIQTWHVGYETSSASYAALEQATAVTAFWVDRNSGGGRAVGVQLVDGVSWTQLIHQDRLQRTLLLTQGDRTTMVTGTASWTELGQLAASITPGG